MSVTSRTNTLFTLPGVTQYAKTGSFNTVVDHGVELESDFDIPKGGQTTKRVCELAKPGKKEFVNQNKNKNTNYHELEVQLMMKDKIIEELLEENGKLIESMNKLEQDKIDERSRIQHGTEMILQQVVEDNEWYKAQFLEMKNELEKAITQTRNKGREITTLEKRCKNLIEEKETIQNFLDELTVQYDERIYQLNMHNKSIRNISKLTKKYLGHKNKARRHRVDAQDTYSCSIHEMIEKIKHLLNSENNYSKIKYLVDQVELNTMNFEKELEEILERINCKSYNCDDARSNYKGEDLKMKTQPATVENENELKLINTDYQKINSELENAKNEIEQLKSEISRKAEIIEELKNRNKNVKLDILDNINNNKEDSKIQILEEKITVLEGEKHELIKKIANFNRNNANTLPQTSDYINRKFLVITQEEFSSSIDYNNKKDQPNKERDDVSKIQCLDASESSSVSSFKECEINDNQEVQEVPISVPDIIEKYIKHPDEYKNVKKEIIQKNSIQRNRYY